MAQFQPILLAVATLFGFTIAGYLLFSFARVRERLLGPLVFVTLNLLFPLYLIGTFPIGWSEAVSGGWIWMVIFFAACLAMMGLQAIGGSLLVRRVRMFRSKHPRELIALFAVHNAGFIPLPILSVFAPPSLMVYMFFYVFAFNIVTWTAAVSYIAAPEPAAVTPTDGGAGQPKAPTGSERTARFRFRLNAPIVGVVLGFLFAASGWYHHLPTFVRTPLQYVTKYTLDLVLFSLGGILARIPRRDLRLRPEFLWFVAVKMVAYPLAVLGLLLLFPVPARTHALASAMLLAFVLEAAAPPGTSIMLAAQSYGTSEQVHYAGNGFIVTYFASLITLPGLLFLATIISR